MWAALIAAAGGLWGRLRLWVILGALAVAALLGAFLWGSSVEQLKDEARDQKERADHMDTARETRRDVEDASDPELDDRFRRWMRDGE